MFHFAEWWYFDAILNEGYSIQISIYVFGFMKYRLAIAGLNIYKNGVPEATKEKIYLMEDFYISTDIPLVILDGKQAMKGYINETTGEWIYDVSLEIDDSSVDLQFIGCNKGWKGGLSIGGWAAILPKANVSGTVRGNGIKIDVVGTGYHDHNWDMTLLAYLNFGWYWGRIISDNISIVWFVIMNTRFDGEFLLVVNKGKDCYINIEPENIYFMPEDFRIKDLRLVPHSFVLMADSQNVSLLVNLTANELHHGRTLVVRQYWRYHLKSQGYIMIDSQMETINGIEIAELKRFR